MKKILVLERVGHMEEVLSDYIVQQFPETELDVIFNVDTVTNEEIMRRIAVCDAICVQSIFDDTATFEKMVALFYSVPAARKPVYLLHTTQKLLQALNVVICGQSAKQIGEMLSDGLEVYNIYHKAYDNPLNDDGGFFKKQYFKHPNINAFDTVKLWFDADNDMIWDERPFFIPYTTKTYFKPTPKPKKAIFDNLDAGELKMLQDLLAEMKSFTLERIEDLECGIYRGEDAGELLKEKRSWVSILEKY